MTLPQQERAPSSFRKPEAMAPPENAARGGAIEPELDHDCKVCSFELTAEEWSYCPNCGWPVNLDEIIELTDEDLESFLFNGYTAKKFELFSGKVRFEVRTLQAKDNNEIASQMSEYSSGKNILNADFQAEQRMRIMARALVSWMGVSLDEDKARASLEGLSEGVLSLIQDRYNAMCRGVEIELAKEKRIKKS